MTTTSEGSPAAATQRTEPARGAVTRHGTAMAGIIALGIVTYLLLVNLTGDLGQAWVLVVLWTIAVTGLNIVQGLGGYLSLAQAAFYGGGAYVSTILLNAGWPMALAAIVAVVAVAVGGLLVGLIFGRPADSTSPSAPCSSGQS